MAMNVLLSIARTLRDAVVSKQEGLITQRSSVL